MESLKLKTKRVEVMIDDDPKRVITFNPEDVKLRARLFAFAKDAQKKQRETEARITEIEKVEGTDSDGLPNNSEEMISLMLELADYVMTGIDEVFGVGTSGIVFADGFDFETATMFINFATGKFKSVSTDKINQQLSKSVAKKKVMK